MSSLPCGWPTCTRPIIRASWRRFTFPHSTSPKSGFAWTRSSLPGRGLDYVHDGKRNPPSIAFDDTTGKYVISPGGDGAESNRVMLGSSATAQRRFATAGQLLAGFANSFVFEFTGGDANLTASLCQLLAHSTSASRSRTGHRAGTTDSFRAESAGQPASLRSVPPGLLHQRGDR